MFLKRLTYHDNITANLFYFSLYFYKYVLLIYSMIKSTLYVFVRYEIVEPSKDLRTITINEEIVDPASMHFVISSSAYGDWTFRKRLNIHKRVAIPWI